jgi:DNA-binding CsgD family transcriptional regulator
MELAEDRRDRYSRDPNKRGHAPEPTPRQREVIQLLAEGRSMKEVAYELKITRRTVAGHKYAVMELLQLKTNADLVQYAIEHGIISLHRTSLPPGKFTYRRPIQLQAVWLQRLDRMANGMNSQRGTASQAKFAL